MFFFVWYKNVDRFYFRYVTMHAFDRQTDGQTDSFLLTRPLCIQCSAVKMITLWVTRTVTK